MIDNSRLRNVHIIGCPSNPQLLPRVCPSSLEVSRLETNFTKSKDCPIQTRVINGQEEATSSILGVLSRAKTNLDVATSFAGPSIAVLDSYSAIYPELRAKGIKVRFITEITSENLFLCKRLRSLGLKLRHLEGLNGNMIVSDEEYLGLTIRKEATPIRQVVHSNVMELVEHEKFLFESIWKIAIPAKIRIRTLENGTQLPEIKVVSDVGEIVSSFLDSIAYAKNEVKIVFPSMNAFHRAEVIGAIDAIERQASRKNLSVRILSPLDREILDRAGAKGWIVADGKGLAQYSNMAEQDRIVLREIDMKKTETNVTIVIVDGERSLVFELKDDSANDFGEAAGLGIYSNSRPTVMSYVAFFEKLWDEMDLSEREARSLRQAELLQDILTHDIRNYNQVSLFAAELVREHLKDEQEFQGITSSLVSSINGSTELVSKAQRLGKIISEGRPKLYSIDLVDSIGRSFSLVKQTYPSKKIKEIRTINPIVLGNPKVLADDLIDEVFTNVLVNAVKYSGDNVEIEISISTQEGEDGKRFFSISIADDGKGIPDEHKLAIFERYTKSKKGNGLGMSITHALVVGRYGGQIVVRDHLPTGSIFEITLPAAN